MKKILLIVALFLVSTTVFCQNTNDDSDDSTYIAEHLKQAVTHFKQRLNKDYKLFQIEYCVDTFKVAEQYLIATKRYNTDFGIKVALAKRADAYEELLNKYYNKLLRELDKEAKSTLIDAQKKWLTFRNANGDVTSSLDSTYLGKGSMSGMEALEFDEDIVVARLNQLYNYYALIEAVK